MAEGPRTGDGRREEDHGPRTIDDKGCGGDCIMDEGWGEERESGGEGEWEIGRMEGWGP
jgi:hypothetical protein